MNINKQARILIVEDDKQTRDMMKEILKDEGYNVIDESGDGKEALNKMKDNPLYDVVLLDIMLPGFSGMDLAQEMFRDERIKNTPVILVSALPVYSGSFRESRVKFNELNVVKDVLEKPFSAEVLLKKVERVVGV